MSGERINAGWEDAEKTEAARQVRMAIAAAESFDALEVVLDEVGRIETDSGPVYFADDLIMQIQSVRRGTATVKGITRTGGLREKVMNLAGAEQIAKAETLDDVLTTIQVLRVMNDSPLLSSNGTELMV